MNKIVRFIKYNNAFTIGIAVFLLVTGSAFANEDIRDTVIGKTINKIQGIDNTQILALDTNNFNLNLTIQDVTENETNYYIAYTYTTMTIQDNIWQPIDKEGTLNVSKQRLEGMDLGIYVSQQLGELSDYELNRIKEVKSIEQKKGMQRQIASITYTGLKGIVFDPEEKILPGYIPVIEEDEEPEIFGDFTPTDEVIVSSDGGLVPSSYNLETNVINQRNMIREIVQEMLAEAADATEITNNSIQNTVTDANPDAIDISYESAEVIINDASSGDVEITNEPVIEETPVVEEPALEPIVEFEPVVELTPEPELIVEPEPADEVISDESVEVITPEPEVTVEPETMPEPEPAEELEEIIIDSSGDTIMN